MFDSLLGGKFYKKCKYSVKCIDSRVQLTRKKRQATVRFLKKDVADLLANGHDANAFGRIEALIVEINHTSCYDAIEKYCQCILNQLPSLQKQRECPEEAMETVSTLIFAAARFSDLPELCDLRRVFTERYESHMESSVNAEFVEKMQKKSFSTDKKLRLMQDIAEEFSVRWDSKAFRQKISNPSAPPSDQPKSSSYNNAAGNQRKESVFEAAGEVNGRNRAALNPGGFVNSRKESTFKGETAVNGRKEAVINTGSAVNGRDRAILNAGGSVNRRKEAVLNAEDITVTGRKEAVINSAVEVNRRNEAILSKGGYRDVPSKERWEPPPPRSSVQKQQVQPEPRDIHVVPIIRNGRPDDPVERTRKVSAAVEETENVAPRYDNSEGRPYIKPKGSQNGVHKDDLFKSKVSKNGIHKDDWLNEGTARNRSPIAQEQPGLIGLERQSVAPVISRDVKAVNMIPPYTILKGVRNGSNAADCVPVYDELPSAEKVMDSIVQERRPTLPVSSKDARPMNMIPPPYTKPIFRNTSTVDDDFKLTDDSTADYEEYDVGERAKPVSVRRRHLKPPLVIETNNIINDAKPMNQSPNGWIKEGRRDNGDLYAEEVVNRCQRKAAEEEKDHARGTSSGQKKPGGRRITATYDGDCDEEEEAMDRLLVHYSKKGMNNESSRRRTRTRAPPAELIVDAGIAEEHHGNGRSYPPQRVASLPSEPTTPVPEVGVSKGPVRATSIPPDMLSPNGARMHPRLPNYNDLAARFTALKNA